MEPEGIPTDLAGRHEYDGVILSNVSLELIRRLSHERRNISAMISATCAEEVGCVVGEIMEGG